jgi:MYXO-CTERM domain-containing protein
VCTPAGGTPADENCNSQVDEGCGCITGHTQSCYTGPPGTAGVGVCRAGTQTCSAGEWGPCLGQVLPSSEICDGQDNACKGTPDLDAPCTSGFECVHGVCVSASCGVESRCRLTSGDPAGGYGCTDAGKCAVSDCGSAPCAPGQTCVGGACADPCSGVVCATGAVCASGICVGGGCYLSGCPVGQLCQQGTCSPDACDGVTCPGGTFCRQGECIQSCVFVHCASGQKCGTDGFCEQDPCAGLQCGATQKCVAGACEPDLCQGKSCGPGLVCNDGVCLDDACNGVSCAGGACVDGQCWATPNPQPIIDTPGSSSKGGCGCGSGDASPLAALLLLAALPLARRRRRAGPGLLLLVLAAGLSASACKKGDSTPAVCGGGGTLCEGTAGCVDLYTDADNCGACSSPCGDGQACSGKVCGPTSAVAPHIASFTPSVGDQGAAVPVAVDLYGERFAAGASVRVVAPSGIQTLPATLVEAGHLQVFLDLEDAAATTLFLRVLNPDNVRSNAVSFNVLTPTPSISALVPPSVVTGAAHDITVQGSGFVTASRCHFSGPSLGEQIIPTVLSGANLICTVDASGLAPSAEYKLWVANDATPTPLLSAQVSLPVASQAPTISDLSPNQAEPNDNLAVLISGDGFDVTSTVLFDGQPVVPAATFLSTKSLYVTALAVGATVRDATIAVRNGSLTSPTKPFYVRLGAPPTVSGLSPGSAYQGDTVTLSFTGGGFPANAVVQLQPPGGAFATVPGSTVNGAGTLVTASKAFTGAPLPPAGDWQARLSYPTTNGISASQIFRLLSSQAILQNASVRGAAQGVASVPVSLTVANLRPPISGVRVIFSGAAGQLTPTGSASPLGVTLSTVGLDTGTYTLQVLNPLGAAPSNSLSFNVTPGVPTLAGVAPTSAHLQDAPVLVTLTGTNFAKPDASDNGGSSVHISSAALGVTDFPIYSTNKVEGSGAGQVLPPYARVQSATQLVLHLDTRVALPGAYDVAVWNPGGLTPPQKSNTLAGAFTITQ